MLRYPAQKGMARPRYLCPSGLDLRAGTTLIDSDGKVSVCLDDGVCALHEPRANLIVRPRSHHHKEMLRAAAQLDVMLVK